MFRTDVIEHIKEHIPCKSYLNLPSHINGKYFCIDPDCHCGRTNHNQHEGSVILDEKRQEWHCERCGRTGDVIDLIAALDKQSYDAELKELAGRFGYEVEDEADMKAFYAECRSRIKDEPAKAFLQAHGISEDVSVQYWIGFDPNAALSTGGNASRIIVPVNDSYFVSLNPESGEELPKQNPKRCAIFNRKAIHAEGTVFVTDATLDALSIIEANGNALALNGLPTKRFLEAIDEDLKQGKRIATFVICLRAAGNIAKELKRRSIQCVFYDLLDGGKFPSVNAALCSDGKAFRSKIKKAQIKATVRPDNVSDYIESIMPEDMQRFRGEIKTGFDSIDAQIGGLYSGLYILAAMSSLGKTTFSLQLAEQIAKNGNDVLFFSLEQSRLELVCKGIARRTAGRFGINREKGVQSIAIRRGFKNQRVEDAIATYQYELADKFSIVEGNFGLDMNFIEDYVRNYIDRTGVRPVVFVDYLQVIAPRRDIGSGRIIDAKMNTDLNMTALKRLSRDEELTVFVISSINRSNYLTPIAFESLKESGGIEYTADCVLGMQLQCLNEPEFLDADQKKGVGSRRDRVEEEKDANPRKIELTSLKNRYGGKMRVNFDYLPDFDLFIDRGIPEKKERNNGALVKTVTGRTV